MRMVIFLALWDFPFFGNPPYLFNISGIFSIFWGKRLPKFLELE